MKKINKFISLLLSVVTIFSFCSACKDNGETSSSSSSDNYVKEEYPLTGEKTDIGKIVETEKIISNNGSTDYKILLPEGASDALVTAANELKFFFSEATNTDLSITTDWSKSGKYFSLGKTSLVNQENLNCTYEEVGLSG